MERLTKRCGSVVTFDGRALTAIGISECREMAARLAAYEDTGLTPEECGEYKKFEDEVVASGKTFGRLVELLHADKAGRLVVLPYKVGDTIYRLKEVHITDFEVIGYMVGEQGASSIMGRRIVKGTGDRYYCGPSTDEIGKTVFFTREEAERAMEGKKDGDKASL